jgi:hypothetical protein
MFGATWTPIECLLFPSSPPAIFGRITCVVVYAVEGQARWWETHVFQKHRKLIPSFTDVDASTAIVFIGCIVGVHAASAHSLPYSIEFELVG